MSVDLSVFCILEHMGHGLIGAQLFIHFISLIGIVLLLLQLSNALLVNKPSQIVAGVMSGLIGVALFVSAVSIWIVYMVLYYKNTFDEFYSFNLTGILAASVGVLFLGTLIMSLTGVLYYHHLFKKMHLLTKWNRMMYLLTPLYWITCHLLTTATFILYYAFPSCKLPILYCLLAAVLLFKVFFGPLIVHLKKLPMKQAYYDALDDENSNDLSKWQDFNRIDQQTQLENLLPANYIISPTELSFISQIGSGAQGVVFLGEYSHSKVAIKCFKKNYMGTVMDLKEFFTEAAALLQYANHYNIVRFIGICDDDANNRISIVTEYYEKGSLADVLERTPPSWTEKLKLLHGIACGVQHLHKIPIIHRDLKCENVLIDGNMVPKIIDFGFARYLKKEVENLTLNVGTAAFTAPEVLRRGEHYGEYDERSDIYSFGIIMYCVLHATRKPYGNMGDIDIIVKVSQSGGKNAVECRPNLETKEVKEVLENGNRWFIELMQQCWSGNVNNRPSMLEIVASFKTKL